MESIQLNITTDYAIRVLLCLGTADGPMGSAELSRRAKVPQTYLASIMSKLKQAGLIASRRGQVGGYALVKPPSEVSLWDVIAVMERAPQLMCCISADYDCPFSSPSQCPVRAELDAAQKSLEHIFQGITLQRLRERMPETEEK